MKRVIKFLLRSISILLIFTLSGCEKEERGNQWTEEMIIYVGSAKTQYIDGFDKEREGIYIKEEGKDIWDIWPPSVIKFFNWKAGYEYTLRVDKTFWKHEWADTYVEYTLKEVVSVKEVTP